MEKLKICFWKEASDYLHKISCEVCVFGGFDERGKSTCPNIAQQACSDGGVWTVAGPLHWKDVEVVDND